MKKFQLFIIAVMLYATTMAQTWVELTSVDPAEPRITVTQNDTRQVSFTVGLPGFFETLVTENSTTYQRLSIQGYGVTGITGEPEIPIITQRIAVPNCSKVSCSVQIIRTQTLTNYMVYPVPDLQPNSEGVLEEVFTINPVAYLQNDFTPNEAYIISETGALRNQHYVTLEIHPIRFNPVSGLLEVATEMEITFTFNKPTTDVNVNTGIFSKVSESAFLNYKGNGKSALIHDKAFEKEGFVPGNVEWITLTDTADACTIPGDYLIITVPEFFNENDPNSQLQRLAEHRAFYNGFDVSIVNVEDILGLNFYYEGNPDDPDPNNWDKYIKEQKMRTFIRRVYEGAHAQHTLDGHLAYVLLVGDNYGDNEGMPTSLDHDYYDISVEKLRCDLYFSCVTRYESGIYDDIGDLFIGRFSVENETHLFNMVQKTINHEREFSPKLWRETAGFTNRELPGYNSMYSDYVSELVTDYGWSCKIADAAELNGAIKIPTLAYLNAGTTFVQYLGFGTVNSWEDGLTQTYFASELHNNYMAPFVSAVGTLSGHFDDMECLGEFLTRYDSIKGAVGYLGDSRGGAIQAWPYINPELIKRPQQERLPYYLFQDTICIAGELLFETTFTYTGQVNTYNLLGDPALNIMAEGYEITRDVTADCPAEIPCRVRIHNGATLTVPSSCNLSFLPKGKLTIDENGSMVIEDDAIVIGLNNEIDTVIHVKGGTFTVGEDVVFQDLSGGILLENSELSPFINTPLDYVIRKRYNFRNVTFNNTPLMHNQTLLNISNCVFDEESHVNSIGGIAVVDSCTFNDVTLIVNNALSSNNLKHLSSFSNSHFTGNNHNTAIQINNSNAFVIENNTITGYETGISLTNSGTTLSLPGFINIIKENQVLSCGTGIELYNTVAALNGNSISNNNNGIRLFNNSYTLFDNDLQPDQRIKNCDSIEMYISANSFPTIFRNNIVWDDNKQGVPLFYWDVEPPYTIQDISFNCWGDDFDPEEDLYPYEAFTWDPVEPCGGKSGSSPIPGNDEILYQSALSYFAEEDFTNAELTFKELIETYPQSRFAIAALHELFALEYFTNNDFYQLSSYYYTFTPEDSVLFSVADFLATRCNVEEKNWQPAVDWYEDKIINPPSYQDSVFAVIDLGDIHLLMEADTTGGGAKGGSVYYSMPQLKPASKQEYETTKSILLATLPQKIVKSTPPTPPTSHLTPHTYKKGSLSQNIPTPATKSTIIPYQIYEDGAIEIRLYNIYGQLLETLPIGTRKQGNYQMEISLTGYSAGMYQYILYINGEKTDSKKMIVN